MWPIEDVGKANECMRDYLFGVGEDKQRSSRLTAWFHTPPDFFKQVGCSLFVSLLWNKVKSFFDGSTNFFEDSTVKCLSMSPLWICMVSAPPYMIVINFPLANLYLWHIWWPTFQHQILFRWNLTRPSWYWVSSNQYRWISNTWSSVFQIQARMQLLHMNNLFVSGIWSSLQWTEASQADEGNHRWFSYTEYPSKWWTTSSCVFWHPCSHWPSITTRIHSGWEWSRSVSQICKLWFDFYFIRLLASDSNETLKCHMQFHVFIVCLFRMLWHL